MAKQQAHRSNHDTSNARAARRTTTMDNHTYAIPALGWGAAKRMRGRFGPTPPAATLHRHVEDWHDHAFLSFRAHFVEVEGLCDLAITEHLHEQVISIRAMPISQRSEPSILTDQLQPALLGLLPLIRNGILVHW